MMLWKRPGAPWAEFLRRWRRGHKRPPLARIRLSNKVDIEFVVDRECTEIHFYDVPALRALTMEVTALNREVLAVTQPKEKN